MDFPQISLKDFEIGPPLSNFLPEKTARKYQVLAVKCEGNTMTLAMSAFNHEAVEDAQVLTGKEVHPVICPENEIKSAIDKVYKSSAPPQKDKNGKKSKTKPNDEENAYGFDEEDAPELEDRTHGKSEESTAPVVKIIDLILMDSCNKGASDIHIEPFEDRVRVRYRIDGHLVEALTVPKSNHAALLARLKIISDLDITESRIPQDGRFKMRIGQKEVDYRVSILPVLWGGKIVLRSLDKSNLKVGLGDLGLSDYAFKSFQTAIRRPYGMIIITGPTGSGKSTTLYSILNELNTTDRNLITVEDPVEYQVEGITQVQAKPEIGMTFASALKAILRQSPDVVMIGEIRDKDTADISVKAALTGQIVLSTLHTNDAAGAIVRLRDMGVESFLLSSSLTLVSAQRLCRKLCAHCKEPKEFSPEELVTLGFDTTVATLIKEPTFFSAKGCARCGRSGYKGRVAINEALLIDEKMKALIEKGLGSQEIKTYAMQAGMLTLRTDALLKFAQGTISAEEVVRVTTSDA